MTVDPVSILWCVPGAESLRGMLASEPAFRLRECLDGVDLAAAALIEPQSIAIVGSEAPRVSADLVMRVESLGTRFVAMGVHAPGTYEREAERAVTRSWGITQLAELQDGAALVSELGRDSRPSTHAALPLREGGADHEDEARSPRRDSTGNVTLVWGTHGAPGRSVVARGLAEAWARSGVRTGLIDADPSASQAISLGITNGDSGVLRAIHLAQRRSLTPAALAHLCRSLSPQLSVLTGLESLDQAYEVTPEALREVVGVAQQVFQRVVIDLGYRDAHADPFASLTAGSCTDVVAVVRHSVVGLARAVRDVPELIDSLNGSPLTVVVNGSSSEGAAREVLDHVFGARGCAVSRWQSLAMDDHLTRAEEHGKLLFEMKGRSHARKDFARIVREMAKEMERSRLAG